MKKIDYRNAFFDELVKIGIKDRNVIFLSADTDADSLQIFKKKFPERFINTGVAEQETINLFHYNLINYLFKLSNIILLI